MLSICTTLEGCNAQQGAKLFFSSAHWQDKRQCQIFDYLKYYLNMRELFFTVRVLKHWHKLPREVVETSFLNTVKTQLDVVLSTILQLNLLQQGRGADVLKRSLLLRMIQHSCVIISLLELTYNEGFDEITSINEGREESETSDTYTSSFLAEKNHNLQVTVLFFVLD